MRTVQVDLLLRCQEAREVRLRRVLADARAGLAASVQAVARAEQAARDAARERSERLGGHYAVLRGAKGLLAIDIHALRALEDMLAAEAAALADALSRTRLAQAQVEEACQAAQQRHAAALGRRMRRGRLSARLHEADLAAVLAREEQVAEDEAGDRHGRGLAA